MALDYLKARSEENILVVTHGFILRVIIAVAIFGDSLTAEECDKIVSKFHTTNVGLTVLGYDEERQGKDSPWWVWVWNDHAHLG